MQKCFGQYGWSITLWDETMNFKETCAGTQKLNKIGEDYGWYYSNLSSSVIYVNRYPYLVCATKISKDVLPASFSSSSPLCTLSWQCVTPGLLVVSGFSDLSVEDDLASWLHVRDGIWPWCIMAVDPSSPEETLSESPVFPSVLLVGQGTMRLMPTCTNSAAWTESILGWGYVQRLLIMFFSSV